MGSTLGERYVRTRRRERRNAVDKLVRHFAARTKLRIIVLTFSYCILFVVMHRTLALSHETLELFLRNEHSPCTYPAILRLYMRDQVFNLLGFFLVSSIIAGQKHWVNSLFALHLVLLLATSISNMPFFGDEPQHLAYVQTLLRSGRIPLTTDIVSPDYVLAVRDATRPAISIVEHPTFFYEAIQPPLYYALMGMIAAPIGFFRHPALSFLALRLAGAIMVSIAFHITLKAINRHARLLDASTANGHSAILASLCAAYVAFGPGFFLQFSTVGNEQLSMLVNAFLFYYMCRWLPRAQWSSTQALTFGILGGLIWLTKLTNIFWLPLICVLTWSRMGFKSACRTAACTIAMGAWWHVYTWWHTGKLTGTQGHLKMVFPILNPDNSRFTLSQFLDRVILPFLSAFGTQPAFVPSLDNIAVGFGTALFVGTFVLLQKGALLVKEKGLSSLSDVEHSHVVLGLWSTIGLWGSFFVALVPTLKYGINFALPRYAYPSLGPIAVVAAAGFTTILRQRIRLLVVCFLATKTAWATVGYVASMRWGP